jgi:hypothetical protein
MFKRITKKEIVVKDALGEPALNITTMVKGSVGYQLLNISGGPGIRDSFLNPVCIQTGL